MSMVKSKHSLYKGRYLMLTKWADMKNIWLGRFAKNLTDFIEYYKTTDHWPSDRFSTKPPTTNHQLTDRSSTNSPITDHLLIDKSFTGPLMTNHQLTNRFSTNPRTINSPTNRPFYNWPPTRWLTKVILVESPLD